MGPLIDGLISWFTCEIRIVCKDEICITVRYTGHSDTFNDTIIEEAGQ